MLGDLLPILETIIGEKVSPLSTQVIKYEKGYKKPPTTDKAKYIYGEGEHGGLDEKLYTHFTSPIRRYVDIITHRMLYNSLMDKYDIIMMKNSQALFARKFSSESNINKYWKYIIS